MIRKIFIRASVVFFWTLLIFGILYWPEETFLSNNRAINVFAWGDILDPAIVADFQKETGIKVNMNFYASNEEMIVKLKATGGQGYDMIIPSDYSVEILAKEGLLKELDKSKLNFLPNLNPKLVNLPFDPGNVYSVPFEWELYLIGIDKTYFANRSYDPSWKMVFDTDNINYLITMINDPIQSIDLVSFYLFGNVTTINDQQLSDVTDLLIAQKKHVNAYADFRADYFLATKNSVAVIASSSYLWRTMKKFPFVGYVLPKEGSVITIENLCIPKPSKKEHLTYQLMNYLYTRASMKSHYDTFSIFPATTDVIDDLNESEDTHRLLTMEGDEFKNLRFTTVVASQEKIRDAWVKIKTD
ncbi:MAG: spermidine/putrescine ABC transporter substrate-binding protein [Rhabdochlamydiaceae bacterium]|jgi:spermidine/putrescine transport system substrate-binding protein